jgi:hypothetical protein
MIAASREAFWRVREFMENARTSSVIFEAGFYFNE